MSEPIKSFEPQNKIAPEGAPDQNQLLKQFMKDLQHDNRTIDSKAVRPIFLGQGNCIRCHRLPEKELNFTPLDFGSFDRNNKFGQVFDSKNETAVERDARELREFERASDFEKIVKVWQKLPDGQIKFGDKSVKLESDFLKAFEAIPGVKPDQRAASVLSSVKSLYLDGDRFTIEMNASKELDIDIEAPLVGKLDKLKVGGDDKKVSLNIKLDKEGKLSLTEIKGISISGKDGLNIGINSLVVDGTGEEPELKVTIDNPLKRPSYVPEATWLKTISLDVPLKSVAPEIGGQLLKTTLEKAVELKDVVQNRDFTTYFDSIPDKAIRTKLVSMLKGLQSINKSGDNIEIVRSGNTTEHDFGGAILKVDPKLSFKLTGDSNSPCLSSISGIRFAVPVPPEFGFGDYQTRIKSVALSSPDFRKGRRLTVEADNLVRKVEVDLDSTMSPITSSTGAWKMHLTADNLFTADKYDTFKFPLKFSGNGQLDMKASDVADIIYRATDKGSGFSFEGIGNYGAAKASGLASDLLKLIGK